MADYFTHFSCVLDVDSPEKAIAALDLLTRLHLDEEGSDDPEYSGLSLIHICASWKAAACRISERLLL